MRYIGNKLKLIDEIDKLLNEKSLKKQGLVFCDLFSGTGTVANEYKGYYKIIANDFLDYAYSFTAGLILYNDTKFKKLGFDPFEHFNQFDASKYVKGFCYNNFSPNGGCQYFSDINAKKIDYIRDTIDNWYKNKKISLEEKMYLIACLLEAVSRVSNVAGVYSAYLKIWDSRALNEIKMIPLEIKKSKFDDKCYCEDAAQLINNINGDVLYIDPPYTPTQYNSQYHVLETIVRNDNPSVHGKGKHRENDRMSNWCKKGNVEFEFENLIKKTNFKHIIFSYSDKGIMSLKFIEAVLKRYAVEGTYTLKKINFVKYKSTRAVKREIEDGTKDVAHYEYLFYIQKSDNIKYASPLNYIGGKYDTLELIKNNLPNEISCFYDVFGGGGTVSLNVNAKKVVYNDINGFVTGLLKFLSSTHPITVYNSIIKYTKKYSLAKGNKEAYINLRNEYNKTHKEILLYLLICYGFEHQIRFNSKHEFNNPCGNSGFNDEMYEKLISFYLRCSDIDIEFNNKSYDDFLSDISKNDLLYCDPPYLGNDGAYQDGKRGFNGWDSKQEEELRNNILKLNKKKIKFMLSNCLEHTNGNKNNLEHWAKENKLILIKDNKTTKRNRQNRREIIIINY